MSDQVCMFSEARQLFLKELDDAYAIFRKMVADPEWCNNGCKTYTGALNNMGTIASKIASLNYVDMSANKEEGK